MGLLTANSSSDDNKNKKVWKCQSLLNRYSECNFFILRICRLTASWKKN